MYIFTASDSAERETERAAEGGRVGGRERERDFEGVTRQEAILGIVLLINEPPESVYVLALCRRE